MTKIREIDYGHISKLSTFQIVKDVCTYKEDRQLLKRALEIKKSIELSKKAFFNLFDEDTKKQLIKLEKDVNKAYKKLVNKTPSVLSKRDTITIGIDHNDNLVIPVKGKTYQAIYRFKREKDEFIIGNSINFDESTEKEKQIIKEYGDTIQELARLLYIQEEFVKYAIETTIRDDKLRDVAIETALYIGYLNGYTLDGIKKKIR